jgi:hypothetical protein
MCGLDKFFFLLSFFTVLLVSDGYAFQAEPPYLLYPRDEADQTMVDGLSHCFNYIHNKKEVFTESISMLTEEQKKYGLLSWALDAWCSLYDYYCANSQTLFEYENNIADKIREFINNGACMQGIYKSHHWHRLKPIKGKHILHSLFLIPEYSSVMCDLWQEIKIRPSKDIRDYSDQETESFLKVVVKALKSGKSHAIKAVQFLWQHNFLSRDWLKGLHLQVSQALYVPNKFDFWWPPLDCSPEERKKHKRKRIKKRYRQKRNLGKIVILSQLLAHSYQNKLLDQQSRDHFIDSNIVTQDYI